MTEQSYTTVLEQILKDASATAYGQFAKITSHEQTAANWQLMQDTVGIVGRQIVAALQANFPSDNIMEASSGVIDAGGQLTWVVNAIQGQANFANGVPVFGVMIGAVDASGPLVGGAALPLANEVYVAERWKGATCNGVRLVASGETDLAKILLSYTIRSHHDNGSTGFTDREMPVLRDIILHTGSLRTTDSAFDVLQVAKGAYGAAVNMSATIYESVAQHILMVESGSVYTDFWGRPIDYSNPLTLAAAPFSYCAAPAALHTALQNLIRPYAS